MKLKNFNDFKKINEGVDIEKFRPMASWIEEIHEIIERNFSDEDYADFMTKIEDEYGEDIANIIDNSFSEDKLHYYYNGMNTPDTSEFVDGFEIYKAEINDLLKEY